jgi:hypothetical protein
MVYPEIVDASGKEPLGGNQLVGLTLRLLDAKLRFEDRPAPTWVSCRVTGGNLVSWDTAAQQAVDAIEPSSYVTVSLTSSSSATIAELEITNLQHMIESTRETHPAFGESIYWSPYDGNDLNAGDSPERAVKTFAKAHDLCDDGHHDVIFGIARDPSGITTVDEQLHITKDWVFLRGSGQQFIIAPTANTGNAITLSGMGGYIGNVKVTHNSIGTAQHGLVIYGDNCTVENLIVKQTRKHGVLVDNAAYATIENCNIHECGLGSGMSGDCIEFKNVGAKHNRVLDCVLGESDIGVCFEAGCSENLVRGSLIHDNTVGIKNVSGAHDTYIFNDCVFTLNTTDVLDGVNDGSLIIEEDERLNATVDSIWDAPISEHTVNGSVGEYIQKKLLSIKKFIGMK